MNFEEEYKQKMTRNYGFVKDIITSDHYVFGASKLIGEKLTDGHWLSYLPIGEEMQYNLFIDTYNCTAYGTANCIETLLRRKFLNTSDWLLDYNDFSERVIGIMAHTKPPGNSPHTVAEAIRKGGLVGQKYLPFDESIKTIIQYYSPDPLTPELIQRGLNFKYGIKHEWVQNLTPEGLKEALCYSPLGVGVFGWQERNGLYFRDDEPANHWVALVDFKEEEYWIVYDSYLVDGKPLKKLEWNYKFEIPKRYAILNINSPASIQKQISIITKIIKLLKQWIILLGSKLSLKL